MDLEGLANRLLDRGFSEDRIIDRLVMEIGAFKELEGASARRLAESILSEVKTSRKVAGEPLVRAILKRPDSEATMHDLGVGCRGEGDFFVHRLVAELAGKNSLMPPEEQDDAGAVRADGKIIVASVDGTHSRLSDFPFIAGFHAARAAMRDVMVKGARPVALVDDLHLSDDGDVGKLFDFVAGIAAVAELAGVPLISGSTLRTGGDMVIGTRMVSGVGCIGVAKKLLKRADAKVGDCILMTKGAGGGTIATTAIYSGNADVVKETLNVDFIRAANALLDKRLIGKIHAMLDVTNGGLRGDAHEVCRTAGVGIELHEEAICGAVNKRVFDLLAKLGIDYLGVSLDSLLVFCAQKDKTAVVKALKSKGVCAIEIGKVVKGKRAFLDGREFTPKFRESAYTPVKKLIGEKAPSKEKEFKEGAERAANEAKEKIKLTVGYIKKRKC